MSRETVEYVVEKSRELMAAPSCSKEAKEAERKAETNRLLQEICDLLKREA